MFEYTHKNHFKFGYNDLNEYQPRSLDTDQFSFQYGRVSNKNLSWKQANELAASQIYDRKVGDIHVLLSGGMDSEICFKSFYDLKLPVKTISLRFTDIDQSNELFYINKAVAKYGIENHEFIDVEVQKIVKSNEFKKLAQSIKCVSPIIVLHMWLANQIKGTPVIAQGEVHLKKSVPANYIPGVSPYEPSIWYLTESERLCSIYMNFILQNKPAIPGFFQYNPEQIYSYLTKNNILQNLIENKIHGKLGTRSSKNLMAHQFYPEIEMREKRHGWESIQEFHDQLRSEMANWFPNSDQSCEKSYDNILKMLK